MNMSLPAAKLINSYSSEVRRSESINCYNLICLATYKPNIEVASILLSLIIIIYGIMNNILFYFGLNIQFLSLHFF